MEIIELKKNKNVDSQKLLEEKEGDIQKLQNIIKNQTDLISKQELKIKEYEQLFEKQNIEKDKSSGFFSFLKHNKYDDNVDEEPDNIESKKGSEIENDDFTDKQQGDVEDSL